MTRIHARHAFSLLELLVVIALLSVLAALAAGTYFRIRNAQLVSTTESTLQKLNVGLENLYSGERDRIDKEFNSNQLQHASMDTLLGFAGGPNEQDRARSIWMYFRLKNEFPQTFPEAVSPTNLVLLPNTLIFSLPPRQTFLNAITGSPTPPSSAVVNGLAPATAEEANLQAAALLYIILTEKSSRGAGFDPDALNAFTREITLSGRPFRVFVDAWGTPITYVRFLTNLELQQRPYTRHGRIDPIGNNPPVWPPISNNPLDPRVRLVPDGWPNFQSFVTSGGITMLNPTLPRLSGFTRQNWLMTIISAGPNRNWDSLDVRGINATPPHANIGVVDVEGSMTGFGWDNLLGYRLRQFGARGD